MKRIARNSDICFNIDEVRGKGEHFQITFYTTNDSVNITKSDQNVIDGKIVLNGTELMTLGEGVLNYRLENIEENANYNDGYFNSSFTRTTDYYLQGGVIIPDGEETQTVMDMVSDLAQTIANEVQRSTGKDNDHTTDIATLQQQIADLQATLDTARTTETNHYNDLYAKWINDHYPLLAVITKADNIEANVSENEEVQAAAFNELREILRENEETIAAALNNLQAQITQ